MDLHELYLSCRVGDLNKIKYLVEQKEVELNVHDKWDSTPLYYACLCGHTQVVQYLLENGARCEANTFDGERCLYGALNSNIRYLLRNHRIISSHVIRRELYQEFLRKYCFACFLQLYEDIITYRLSESVEYADICFVVHERKFYAHKCILSVRSEYFLNLLLGKWRHQSVVRITHRLVNPEAFRVLLQFFNQGRLEIHVDYIEDLLRLARKCKVTSLIGRIEETVKKTQFLQCTKPGTKVTTLVVEPEDSNLELSSDFSALAEEALPVYMRYWIGADELPFYPDEIAPFADVVFEVENRQFLCHQAFFCTRSDYFKTMLKDSFCEDRRYHLLQAQGSTTDVTSFNATEYLPTFTLKNISVAAFCCVLYYVYTDQARLTVHDVYDVLLAADLYLLPGLKRQCGSFIAKFLSISNVYLALRTARLFQLPKLEDQCYQFMAENLEQIIEMIDFHEIVRSDALSLETRHDVDSIDVIDNIRFHLISSSMYEAQDKLTLIDSLLDRLDLDA